MRAPQISAIIPCYNAAGFLPQALQSVMQQTLPAFEILVVDDGSTDGSAEAVHPFAPLARCLRLPHAGPAIARNHGIALARGEFLAFLDADDLWTPDKLAVQVEYMTGHPEIQYTNARARFFLEPGFGIPAGFRPEWLETDYVTCTPSTLVARRSLFDTVGLFDLTLISADDLDWFMRARDMGVPTAVIDQVLLLKRVHASNLSIMAPTASRDMLRTVKRSIDRKRSRPQSPGGRA